MADNRCSGCISHNVECTYDACVLSFIDSERDSYNRRLSYRSHNKKKSGDNISPTLDDRLADMEGKVSKSLDEVSFTRFRSLKNLILSKEA